MSPRQIRRAAERKAAKQARKALQGTAAVAPTPVTPIQLEANRANARLSSGPRTSAGKAISARNNFRHGFTGAFAVLPTEDQAAYDQLVDDLRDEHDPQTPTEDLLVGDLARHHWLTQRALRLQDEVFLNHDLNDPAAQKQLALYIRYQTTNQRAFHKCLADLLKFRKSKPCKENGFESKKREPWEEKLDEINRRYDEAVAVCRQPIYPHAQFESESENVNA